MNDLPDPLSRLLKLHDEVDRKTAPLVTLHGPRLNCRPGCHDCCVDEITVFEIEAERIRRRHAGLLLSEEPHPEGACAFLDGEGDCRIYEDRPYVCRTQGLPLRWREESGGDQVELRDICPLNELPDAPLESLPADACWTLGSFEGRLATLEIERGGAPPARIRLRDLWARAGSSTRTAGPDSARRS